MGTARIIGSRIVSSEDLEAFKSRINLKGDFRHLLYHLLGSGSGSSCQGRSSYVEGATPAGKYLDHHCMSISRQERVGSQSS